MKPVKLTLAGFGSFYEKTEIDFGSFGDGVFLIHGETGAGKTTIFDALVFALYGEASGSAREAGGLRSGYCVEGDETVVELVFTIGGDEYVVTRRLEYAEPGKAKPAYAALKTPDGRTISGERRDTVTERVRELLGLDVRQFTQICLLPQGEFEKILQHKGAKGESREDILMCLFGVEAFDFLQKKLNDYALMLGRDCERESDAYYRQVLNITETDSEELKAEIVLYKKAREKRGGQYGISAKIPGLLGDNIAEKEAEYSELERAHAEAREKAAEARSAAEVVLHKNRQHEKMRLLLEEQAELKTALSPEKLDFIEGYANFVDGINADLMREQKGIEAILAAEDGVRQLQRYARECAEREREFQQDTAAHEAEKAIYEQMTTAFLRGQASLLAGELRPGEPCPVCGSVKHPAPCAAGEEVPTEKMLERQKQKANAASGKAAASGTSLAAIKSRMETLSHDEGVSESDMEKRVAELKSAKSTAEARITKLRAALAEGTREYRELLGQSGRLEQIGRELPELVEALGGYTPEEAREEGARALATAADEISRQMTARHTVLVKQREILRQLVEIERAHSAIYPRYKSADEMAKWSKGAGKISLTRYVLGLYLDEILDRANRKLVRMSGSRFVLSRSTAPGSTGLEIDVFDERSRSARPAGTLSGGEKFKASLAMALGMSETVQTHSGGTRLGTLLIDEGFGSLDMASVSSAVDTISALTSRDMMIGIISHVDMLKSRIEKQIQVIVTEKGSKVVI